jgi:hypothetical protein
METFCSDSHPCDNQQGILDKCKAWIGSTMAMFGARSRQPTSRMILVWVFVVANVWATFDVKTIIMLSSFVPISKMKSLG